jgi:hypothetical protein
MIDSPGDEHRGCSKHVENWNKYLRKRVMHQVGYLQELNRDAPSAKHNVTTGLYTFKPWTTDKCKTFNYSVCDIRCGSIIISHNDSVIATLDSCRHSKPQQRMTSEALRVKPILSRSEPS